LTYNPSKTGKKEGCELKAVINTKKGEVVLMEIPLRELGPEEVKVRMAFCGIGGADPTIIDGSIGLPLPWHMGYQGSGTIAETGPGVTARGLKVGDRVAINHLRACGACYECLHGYENMCSNLTFPHGWLDSMMAEYAVLHQKQVWKLPDSVSLEEGTLTEVIAASMQAIELAPLKIGSSVLVSGGGGNGLILLQLAALQGGTRLTIIEPVEAKRKLALKLGADYVIDPEKQDIVAESMKITENRGFDRVIEASGAPEAVTPCLDVLAKGGKIVLLGIYPKQFKLNLDINKLYFKEGAIFTTSGYANIFPKAVGILPKMNLKAMLGPVFPLENFMEAIEAHKTGQYAKVLVKC
jgi:2-desacetyl-2-hydroxyethyl bacteriochlorophyllide A dehydrogenase